MTNYELIKQAILHRMQVHASYKGNRKMCPHVLGYKHGKAHALFVQFEGESQSQKEITANNPQWRCIPIEKMGNIELIQGEWHSIPFQKETHCIDTIDLQVVEMEKNYPK